MRQLPHFLTLLRIAATPFVVWLIVESRFREALWLVAFAAVTDWFDGYTARLLGSSGKLGTVLDPMADKVMLVGLFVALSWVGLIPLWVLILVMGRDLVIVTGSLLLRLLRNVRKFLPSITGKVSTFFQIIFVLLVLLHAAFPVAFLGWLKLTALCLTVIFTAWSGFGYIQLGIHLAKQPKQASVASI